MLQVGATGIDRCVNVKRFAIQQISSVNIGQRRAGAAKLTLNVHYLIIVERPKHVLGISIHKFVLIKKGKCIPVTGRASP
jgi:hypothetical protein